MKFDAYEEVYFNLPLYGPEGSWFKVTIQDVEYYPDGSWAIKFYDDEADPVWLGNRQIHPNDVVFVNDNKRVLYGVKEIPEKYTDLTVRRGQYVIQKVE